MTQPIKAGGKKLLFPTDKVGKSVLHLATFICALKCQSCVYLVEAVWLLIKDGGKKLLLMTDCDGNSELHVAARWGGHVQFMQLLIEAGGNATSASQEQRKTNSTSLCCP